MRLRRRSVLAHGFAGLLACSAALAGCEVGRALVAQGPVAPPPPALPDLLPCAAPIDCADAGPPAASIPARAGDALELDACPGGPWPEVCPAPDDGSTVPDDDAGVAFDGFMQADEERGPPCEPPLPWQALAEKADGLLKCTQLAVGVEPDGADSLELSGVQMDGVNLRLRASEPVTVRWLAPSLQRVWIELSGPVRLEWLRPARLDDVRVRGVANAAGAPALAITERQARQLLVGSPGQPFEGTVELARVAVRGSQILVRGLSMLSSTFYDGLLEAEHLDVVESELDHVVLGVGAGRIAASAVTQLEVTDCGSLSLLGTTSKQSNFVACSDGPLRVYQSNVTRGLLDGVIDTDLTDICNVRLGRRSPTELRLWSGTLLGTNLCAGTTGLLVGGRAARNACEAPDLEGSDAVCTLQADQQLDDNDCGLIQTAAMCETLPPRERPEQDRGEPEGRLTSRL